MFFGEIRKNLLVAEGYAPRPPQQGRIKAGADGAAAPGPPTKIGLSITTYYEQLSDFFINQLFYFKVEYELPIFIGLIYPV